MDALEGVKSVIEALYTCYQLYQEIQANKSRRERLKERVEAIEGVMNDVAAEELDNQQVRCALDKFKEVLTDAVDLITKHKDMNWLKAAMKVNDLKEEFAELNEGLSYVYEQLRGSLHLEQVRKLKGLENAQRRRDDQADAEADHRLWEREILPRMESKIDDIHRILVHGGRICQESNQYDTVDTTKAFDTYKDYIQEQFGRVKEYNSRPGCDWVTVSKRYTDLVMVTRPQGVKMREEEIRSRGAELDCALARANKQYVGTSVEKFFSQQPNSKAHVSKAVILQGHSGYGKTFTAHRIIDDWASGKLYNDLFDLVFLLKLKALSNVEKPKSLVDFLLSQNTQSGIDESTVRHVLKHAPHRVLFILDGFDELRLSREDMECSRDLTIETPASVNTILVALLKGKLLNSSLLVTSRSTASKRLSDVLEIPHCFTEILGFSNDGVKKYIQAFFVENEDMGSTVQKRVMEDATLLTACSIPVTCWIICNVFEDMLQDGEDISSALYTTTSIFAHFVSMQMEHHGPSQAVDDDQWSGLIRSLGELAMEGVMKQIVLFDDSDVDKRIPENLRGPFLGKFFLKKISKFETKYSFMHLSFQEFFAALFHLCDLDVAEEKITSTLKQVEEDLYTSKQKLKMSHLLPVIQFLFGLSNQDVTRLPGQPEPDRVCPLLEKWIHDLIKEEDGLPRTHNIQLFILYCLYEAHEEGFVQRAMCVWNSINLVRIPLTMSDCRVLSFCIQHCPAMEELTLMDCNLTGEMLGVLAAQLAKCKTLGVKNSKQQRLRFSLESVLQVLNTLAIQKQVETLDLKLSVSCDNSAPGIIDTSMEDVCVSLSDQPQELETAGLLDISVERKIKEHITELRCENILKLGLDNPALCLSGISVNQTASPELFRNDWTGLLETVHSLADSPLALEKADVEQIETVQSCLLQVPNVKTIELAVKYLTADMATRFLFSCLDGATLQKATCKLSEVSGRENSVCSEVSLINMADSVMLTVEAHAGGSLSEVELDMATVSKETDWARVFQDIAGISGREDLSFMRDVSGLQRLFVTVTCLTESWAAALLQLQTPATPPAAPLQYCSLRPDTDSQDNICSFLSVERQGDNIMLLVEYNKETTPLTEMQITDISLSMSQEHLACLDLHTIRTLRDLDQRDFVKQVKCVPGIRKIKLVLLGNLTEDWADPLAELIEGCPSLCSITLDAEQFLLEEGVQALQDHLQSFRENQISRPQLNITLTGQRCSKTTDPCTAFDGSERDCNHWVQLQSSQLEAFTNTHTLLEPEQEQEEEAPNEEKEEEEKGNEEEVNGEDPGSPLMDHPKQEKTRCCCSCKLQ
ncbi:uncharacterized protein LOC134435054 isoform X2 [Engraulis encrasicolus]|uniref:uncharacterized protein LOC134435054 isoform X2 n=1 Tax=Engraulis encrasicolus TaxID=184585 RepID=UPI002FD6F03C